jgi:hypothetical protein
MAKINRENSVRERRARKQAKKDARRQAVTGVAGGSPATPIGDGPPSESQAGTD